MARSRTGGSQSQTRAVPSIANDAPSAPTPKRARRTETDSEEPRRVTVAATTTVTAPAGTDIDMNAEIESAKQLVRDLKRELQLRAAAGDELEDTGYAQAEGSRGTKRGNQEEGTAISGGAGRGTERTIRTNRRVQQGTTVGQTVKRAAFGAMLFGLGATAAM